MTKCHLMLHLHSPSLSPLYSSPFYIPFSTSPFYTPLISSSLQSASTPFSTISTAQSPLGSPLVTRQTPYMTNPPLPLPIYLLSAPLFYIPSLHPYFTPYLPPIYIYPPHASPPFDTPSLLCHSTLPVCTPYLSSYLLSHSTTPI